MGREWPASLQDIGVANSAFSYFRIGDGPCHDHYGDASWVLFAQVSLHSEVLLGLDGQWQVRKARTASR
jgi:hypothetical protein